jgi:predicted transcriptional regulator
MSKKRYTLYLSPPLARKFDLVAKQRQGAKSALVEEALRVSLEPEQHPGIEDGLARHKTVAQHGRDQNVATETLALFVRYFLTVTPPLPESDQESARLLGRKRFEVFVAEVGRRVAEDRRLAAEVLQTIPIDQPDLFATVPGDTPLKNQRSPRNLQLKSNGRAVGPGEGADHG